MRHDGASVRVFAKFSNEASAYAYLDELQDEPKALVEFDPVVAWGDGKKSKYGPTYASEVNEDWLR